jgi:hypothetical protein
MELKRRVEMDEQELRMERAEGAEAVEIPEDLSAAADDLKDAEEFVETESALEPGEELAHGGAGGAEKQTPVCFNAEAKEPTGVGAINAVEEPVQGDAAAGEMEPAEAVNNGEGPEAEWKRQAEGYALRAVFSEARAAAAAMGVPENRLDHVAKLSDLSGVDPEDGEARVRVAKAVRAVLKELPELCGGVGTGQVTAPRRSHRDAFERGFLGE